MKRESRESLKGVQRESGECQLRVWRGSRESQEGPESLKRVQRGFRVGPEGVKRECKESLKGVQRESGESQLRIRRGSRESQKRVERV